MSSRRFNTIDPIFSDHVGIDFDTRSVRVIKLKRNNKGMIPVLHRTFSWPDGVVVNGIITDKARAVTFLKQIKKSCSIHRAYASLPDTVVATEMILLAHNSYKTVRQGIQKHFTDTGITKVFFDHRVLGKTPAGMAVQVVSVAKDVLDGYLLVTSHAGIALVGIEPRHAALARAITKKGEEYFILVDIHGTRTSVSVLAKGIPIMTEEVPFGGRDLSQVISKVHGIDTKQAWELLETHGVSTDGEGKKAFQELGEALVILEDLVKRAAAYWHEQKTWHANHIPISRFHLSGEASTVPGLADYLSATLRHEVLQTNVWQNCFSFQDVIPDISRDEAAPYAAAIGLALAPAPSDISLLPKASEHAMVRKEHRLHILHKIGIIIITTILAAGLAAVCVLVYQYIVEKNTSQNTSSVVQ